MSRRKGMYIAILCGLCLVAGFVLILQSGILIPDRTAEYTGDTLLWQGRQYIPAGNCAYEEGRPLARAQDGTWTVYAVKEDPAHTFVVLSSFLDQRLFVAGDCPVPTEGTVTLASWSGKSIDAPSFLQAVSQICAERITSYTYETTHIYALNDVQRMKGLYLGYEDCPLATQFVGLLGKIHGQWVITTHISEDQRNPDGSPKPYMVGLYQIPEAYHGILEEYYFE